MFAGKRALVTGGSGAIGSAICEQLASNGCEVVLSYFSDREAAERTRGQIEKHGAKATVLRANFADEASTTEFLAQLATFDGFDFLVSNAASGVMRPIAELQARHWKWSHDVNVGSLFRIVTTLLAPQRLLRDEGRIVALSSLGATRAIPQYAAVGASKAALESLVRSLCFDLGPRGITANVIAPGLVMTKALDHFPNKEQLISVAQQKTPIPRLVTPSDVASVVAFLLSPAAAMISGQTITVDGGYSAVA